MQNGTPYKFSKIISPISPFGIPHPGPEIRFFGKRMQTQREMKILIGKTIFFQQIRPAARRTYPGLFIVGAQHRLFARRQLPVMAGRGQFRRRIRQCGERKFTGRTDEQAGAVPIIDSAPFRTAMAAGFLRTNIRLTVFPDRYDILPIAAPAPLST